MHELNLYIRFNKIRQKLQRIFQILNALINFGNLNSRIVQILISFYLRSSFTNKLIKNIQQLLRRILLALFNQTTTTTAILLLIIIKRLTLGNKAVEFEFEHTVEHLPTFYLNGLLAMRIIFQKSTVLKCNDCPYKIYDLERIVMIENSLEVNFLLDVDAFSDGDLSRFGLFWHHQLTFLFIFILFILILVLVLVGSKIYYGLKTIKNTFQHKHCKNRNRHHLVRITQAGWVNRYWLLSLQRSIQKAIYFLIVIYLKKLVNEFGVNIAPNRLISRIQANILIACRLRVLRQNHALEN